MPTHYDMVIIGAGPSGEGCAMRATKQGLRVAVVDDQGSVGGSCTHWGTIPSKALRHAVQQIIRFNTDNMFRDIGEPRFFSFSRVLKRAERIIQKQVDLRTTFYAKNRVKLYFGQARFVDPHTLEVCAGEGVTETLKANHIVICTGSRPYHPPDVDFSLPRIYDSDTILSLDFDPKKIIIYGAGSLGVNMRVFSVVWVCVLSLLTPAAGLWTFWIMKSLRRSATTFEKLGWSLDMAKPMRRWKGMTNTSSCTSNRVNASRRMRCSGVTGVLVIRIS